MPRRSSGPGLLALFAVVALAALLFGLWLGPRLRPEPPPAEGPKAEAPDLRIDEALTFDDLATFLRAHENDPAARAFARDFASKPRLRNLWNRFVERNAQSRARQENGPTARDFVRELKALREFSELFSNWSKNAAFRASAERLAARPGMAAMVRQAAAVGSARQDPDPGNQPGRVFGLYAVDPPTHGEAAVQRAAEAAAGSGPGLSAGGRAPADPRIEGHWVQDGGSVDPLAICLKLGAAGQCQQVILDCRKDPACSRKLGGYGGGGGGHGGVAASTRPATGEKGTGFKMGDSPPK